MRKKMLFMLVFLALNTFGALGLNLAGASPELQYPSVYVDPANIVNVALTPGQNFSVAVKTDYNGSDIQAWQFNMSFNPTVLNCVNVTNGDLITTVKYPTAQFKAGAFDNTEGKIRLSLALFFSIGEPYPITSGPGTLAYVNFTVVGTGTSSITLGSKTILMGYTEDGYGEEYQIVNATMPNHIGHGYFANGGLIAGKVTDDSTGSPIEGATISANGMSATTNSTGGYTISAPAGNYAVTASATGYKTSTVTDVAIVGSETKTVDFALTPAQVSAGPPDILTYAIVAIAIVIVVAIALYYLKIRKSK